MKTGARGLVAPRAGRGRVEERERESEQKNFRGKHFHGDSSGRGVEKATQTSLDFLPEHHTDFIFSVVGEELGFIGGVSLLGFFGVMMWRIWRAAVLARDQFGRLVCVGVLGMFVFQIFENVGMTMGITPVTGIPLPFMSYGGSAMIASFIGVGLTLNVHMRRFS